VFGDRTFGEVDMSVTLAITAFDITNGKRCVFRNTQPKYLNVKIADAVIASCCAPSYFDSYEFGGNNYIDGAMGGVNNPSIVAYDIASKEMGREPMQIHLTSYSTGAKKTNYLKTFRFWQLWDVPKVVDMLLSQAQENADEQMRYKPASSYQRVSMGSEHSSSSLDDFSDGNIAAMRLDADDAIVS
jgi:predicted acylesterase/phospholipase RssA